MYSSRKNNIDRSKGKDGASGCFVLIIIAILVWYFGPWDKHDSEEIKALEKLTQAQTEQIKTLKKSQLALEELIDFIQKEKIDAELKANDLKSDIERLRDLQKVDQEIVNKIFVEQQKQKDRERYTEWVIAFVIGIFSTLVFELIKNWLLKFKKRNRKI